MQFVECCSCGDVTPEKAFRSGRKDCVWCQFNSMEKRAKARHSDKLKSAGARLKMDKTDFVSWYTSQRDQCAYCGLTFFELKQLRLQKGKGYCVSWDVDCIDPKKGYKLGNFALSCFVCNMAKGNTLFPSEMKLVGAAVSDVWRKRLAAVDKI
ncbi:hypothetical protein ACSEE7_18265 [Halomonas cupida]|uniref:hypothetical protein n=1 Tax=Halomonas cupida TaxID=44933 RepID=UPI003EFA5851